LNDKNGLLFTYGVTGSGKTHTMQGSPQEGGLLPRAIDVIFNSMEELQVRRKYLIVPDKTNSFQVQDPAEAMLNVQVHKKIVVSPLILYVLKNLQNLYSIKIKKILKRQNLCTATLRDVTHI
jgi:hypothetical protein